MDSKVRKAVTQVRASARGDVPERTAHIAGLKTSASSGARGRAIRVSVTNSGWAAGGTTGSGVVLG